VQGVDYFDVIAILTGYGLEVLDPPPSLRDTSASGGQEAEQSDTAISQYSCLCEITSLRSQ